MTGFSINGQPIEAAMSPEFFDRTTRKLKLTATKKTAKFGYDVVGAHFTPEYLGEEYGPCVYAFQGLAQGMPPFGFVLFNDVESASRAKADLHAKGFQVRPEIC